MDQSNLMQAESPNVTISLYGAKKNTLVLSEVRKGLTTAQESYEKQMSLQRYRQLSNSPWQDAAYERMKQVEIDSRPVSPQPITNSTVISENEISMKKSDDNVSRSMSYTSGAKSK